MDDSGTTGSPSPLRLLIGDDHPGVVRAFSRFLGLSYDVVGSVADGGELPEAVRRLQPDVIVLDIHLGEVDGCEACRRILAEHPGIKVVLCSAADDPGVRRRALEAGAHAFVSKLAAVVELPPILRRLDAERGV